MTTYELNDCCMLGTYKIVLKEFTCFFKRWESRKKPKIQFFNEYPITLIFHYDKNASPFEIVEVAISMLQHMIQQALASYLESEFTQLGQTQE
jgi:hypothetical protein